VDCKRRKGAEKFEKEAGNEKLTRIRSIPHARELSEKFFIRLSLNTFSLAAVARASAQHQHNHYQHESEESDNDDGLDRDEKKADERDKLAQQHNDERNDR
jgi:phage-related minor tail protein